MIQFIFFSIIISLAIFILALFIESEVLIILSMMAFIINGIYVLVYGMEQINNFLTLVVGIIILSIGMYYFIRKEIERVQEAYGG